MRYKIGNPVVVAFGGSIICPDGVDVSFLKKFKKFADSYVQSGKKLILVIGGGKISRDYQGAASRLVPLTDDDKDWIGIHATRLNAHLLRTIFRDNADPVVIDARHRIKKLKYPITVASGWQPGWSTDYVAMALAHDFGANASVIAGKPDAVYESNPDTISKKRPKKFSEMSWGEYRKLIPKRWSPGLHSPVDPVAAQFGEAKGISAIIVRGTDLKNLSSLLNGKEFKGTLIQN